MNVSHKIKTFAVALFLIPLALPIGIVRGLRRIAIVNRAKRSLLKRKAAH